MPKSESCLTCYWKRVDRRKNILIGCERISGIEDLIRRQGYLYVVTLLQGNCKGYFPEGGVTTKLRKADIYYMRVWLAYGDEGNCPFLSVAYCRGNKVMNEICRSLTGDHYLWHAEKIMIALSCPCNVMGKETVREKVKALIDAGEYQAFPFGSFNRLSHPFYTEEKEG